jgi:hypothetical protein
VRAGEPSLEDILSDTGAPGGQAPRPPYLSAASPADMRTAAGSATTASLPIHCDSFIIPKYELLTPALTEEDHGLRLSWEELRERGSPMTCTLRRALLLLLGRGNQNAAHGPDM